MRALSCGVHAMRMWPIRALSEIRAEFHRNRYGNAYIGGRVGYAHYGIK